MKKIVENKAKKEGYQPVNCTIRMIPLWVKTLKN